MKKILLPLLMAACFFSETVFMEWFPGNSFDGKWIFSPRFFLIALLILTIFFKRSTAMKYGFIFGFLYDLYYTEILGVYMLFFPFLVYITSKLMKMLHNNLWVVALVVLFDLALLEVVIYELNVIVQRTSMSFTHFLSHRLWPTLVLNWLFYILFSFALKWSFEKLRKHLLDE
ncbi:rod shape-determining protein MreD [Oikeobacillus pervagus]|uniref:Rod shape-determining protein MreD n=1 Tax=Oikeobacillus pervagus TaxID=1325931 RepID=A0AAJ1T0L8_9BACI|nr:rod shape-determining protein MreD [Oikeobacillus pervagus]MDQ0214556.1 rod shape-determining protein MreD [Oikeobacillus pervagus]